MEVKTVAEQLLFATALIQASDGEKSWTGTGFVCHAETTAGSTHFLVSNKHVLGPAKQITVTMVQAEGTAPRLGSGTRITTEGDATAAVRGHPQ